MPGTGSRTTASSTAPSGRLAGGPAGRPVSRALRPDVGPGTLLAGRYRLVDPLPPVPGDPDEAARWRACDDVLDRPVDVLLILASGKRSAWGRDLLQAAAAAGAVRSPGLVQVYDAALEEVPAVRYGRPAGTCDIAYVVSEHVPGTTLSELLADDGPLDPAHALALGLEGAEALRVAHERGVLHGGITPATVLLTEDGGLRLRDTGVAAVLAQRSDGGSEPARTAAEDVHAFAACLYAMLTARWPGSATEADGAGLRPAPVLPDRGPAGEGRLCSPRQVRAGVPRHLDDAVLRVLQPGGRAVGPSQPPVETADALLRLLTTAGDADAAARVPVPRPRRRPELPPTLRRRLPYALVALLLVVAAVGGYTRGRSLGTVQETGSELEALVDSTPPPVPGDGDGGGGQRIDLALDGLSVTAFDPPPGDGAENNAAVPNVLDGDPGTAWETERYDTSRFGGLKPGVGLLVDLGEPAVVEQVELGLTPGVDVELRAADEPFPDADGYAVVAAVPDAEQVARLVPAEPVTARYFLVWFTRLPPDGDRWRAGVREMFFVRP